MSEFGLGTIIFTFSTLKNLYRNSPFKNVEILSIGEGTGSENISFGVSDFGGGADIRIQHAKKPL